MSQDFSDTGFTATEQYAPLNRWCQIVGIGPTKAREEIRDKKYRAVKNGKRLLVDVPDGLRYYRTLPVATFKTASK